jgi:AcrR family transcriptional regulator
MERRRADVEETRRRITEATLALHSEKGIFGTSWRDIAQRADVSVATVYKHFPTLEELVPACGELLVSRTNPPTPDEGPSLFGGARTTAERIERLLRRFFGFYERAERYLEMDARERALPAVMQWEAEMRAVRELLMREALGDLAWGDAPLRAAAAMIDFPVYAAFRRHDLGREEAERVAREMLLAWLPGQRRPG